MSFRKRIPVRVNPRERHREERRVSLGGEWECRLDPEDRGLDDGWYAAGVQLPERVLVPGCWQGQGFGGDDTDLVWDFRLRARTFRATYTGTGWYRKCFEVDPSWRGRRIWLNFGGVHPSADVWVNGTPIGGNGLPFVPFGFDVTDLVSFDAPNAVAVRVHEENRLLGFAYNWQGNWSGLYRGVELTATGGCHLARLSLLPDADTGNIILQAQVERLAATEAIPTLSVCVTCHGDAGVLVAADHVVSTDTSRMSTAVTFMVNVPDPKLWSPDHPALYRVEAILTQNGETADAIVERTGFVKLFTRGKQFFINGEPYYLRGTGDFVSCPETGCPDVDRERWRKKLTALREYGYNYVRCQSYVYPPEYFDIADEVGLLIQSEMGMLGAWGGNDAWHTYAWPKPTPDLRELLREQWNLVVERDANHPAANIYCMSNELGTTCDFPRTAWRCYEETKANKPSSMVIWTDGGYHADLPGDFVNAEASLEAECDKPVVQHEFRWWSSFPDVRNAHKYQGAMRSYAVEIAREAARAHGISHILVEAAENSQRLQFIEAKGKMEACRRDHPQLAGICHFNAMDANPSPQGVIDEFYERKIASAATWLRTNGDTVVLSSLQFDGRVWSAGDELQCDLCVSDFSHPCFNAPIIDWQLSIGEDVSRVGRIVCDHRPYETYTAGSIATHLPEVSRPVRAQLRAVLREAGRSVDNEWDLWLFPNAGVSVPPTLAFYGQPRHTWLKELASLEVADAMPERDGVRAVITERLDKSVVDFARSGGRVIFAASEGLARPFSPKLGLTLGRYFFTPPANYPPYEDGHNGTIIRPHPMLGDFPRESFADLAFYRMIGESAPLDIGSLGLSGDPVIRAIHSYPVSRSLGYLVEAGIGRGRIILTALDLNPEWVEARYLLNSICAYVVGDELTNAATVADAIIERLQTLTELP